MGVFGVGYFVCVGLFVIGLSDLSWQSTELVTEVNQETVCFNVDIRNHVSNFKKLTNCTVIEGFLQILLIDYGTPSNYENLHFPRLREITGYLLLYRVNGLKTLSHIFPNLAVIRGRKLFFNYALVAFEMNVLQNLGLSGLTTIENGAVRFEKNSMLCHLDTIDWDLLVLKKSDNHFLKENRDKAECANVCPRHCPKRLINGENRPICWDSEHCQIDTRCTSTCPNTKFCNGDACCHPECFGGCYGLTDRECYACKEVFHQGRCLPHCPLGTYKLNGRRCVTRDECKSIDRNNKDANRVNYKPFDDGLNSRCISECPANYQVDKNDYYRCIKCKGRCPKICPPAERGGSGAQSTIIDSITSAAQWTGCNIVMNNLEITITGGKNIAHELEKALGDIEEVHGFVKVARSYALVSLSFFKNLRLITGGVGNRGLERGKYAFILLDNSNLQDIWNVTSHPRLTITQGAMFMHFNRKLCLDKIDAFINETTITATRTNEDISTLTNGDEAACTVIKLNLTVSFVMSDVVIISWTQLNSRDDRSLLSYLINYREAPFRNISTLDGKDACTDNMWKTLDYQPPATNDSFIDKMGNEEPVHLNEIIPGLKPFTQYAMYVQTYTISTAKRGGISNLIYITTKPKEPSIPEAIQVYALAEGQLKVKWLPPREPNGNVTHYLVLYRPQALDVREFEKRNYCWQKLRLDEKRTTPSKDVTDKPGQNVTVKDGQCCSPCPKSKEEREREELEKQIQIRFENYLHSMIFQKRPDAQSPGSRKRRSLESLPDYRINGSYDKTQVHGSTIGLLVNDSHPMAAPSNNSGDPEEPVWQEAFVYGSLETTLHNLEKFTIYSIQVIACHDRVPDVMPRCSNSALASKRTLPSDSSDNVSNVSVIYKQNAQVLITWSPPADPNSFILMYEVRYQKKDDHARVKEKCITHKNYSKVGGFLTESLESGNYSVQVRATSLAGNGSWSSKDMYFTIKELEENTVDSNFWTPTVIGLIIGGMLLILAISVTGVIIFFKRRESQNIPDSVQYASVNPDYLGWDSYIKDEWEVDREKVKLLHELGQGSFGMVYEGVACDLQTFPEGVAEMKVAVKTVNEQASTRDRIEFLNEASVMKAFNCYHVVRLLGVVSEGQPTLVIMELMERGDLKNHLRMHRPDEPDNEGRQPPTLKQTLQMAAEIADGMAYLGAKKFVHRDLAARNCMVDVNNTVKIGDFGMTRDIYEHDYYRKGGKGLLPVRWMAPESLKDGVFTSASDVWSYGVVLWEMATLAAQPYQGLANEQVLKFVQSGQLMEIPEGCPQKLYDLMMLTWRFYPKQRPTFQDIIQLLLPDVNEEFQQVSYFHSVENQQDLAHEAEKFSHAEHSIDDDPMDNSNTPLTSANANYSNCLSGDVYFRNNRVTFGGGGDTGDNGSSSSEGNNGDSRELESSMGDGSPLRNPEAITPMASYNNMDFRRESCMSNHVNSSAIPSEPGGSKESSSSKSSNDSSHRNGFINGHAHLTQGTEC